MIDGPAGPLEVVCNAPPAARRGIALVAHPHPLQGGTLDNKVAQTLAKAFFALGYVAVRFNFRGVGASHGAFDEGVGETEDALGALAYARAHYGAALPVALAGFSFGSYVQTRVAKRFDRPSAWCWSAPRSSGSRSTRCRPTRSSSTASTTRSCRSPTCSTGRGRRRSRSSSFPAARTSSTAGCTQLRDTIVGMWHRGRAPGA